MSFVNPTEVCEFLALSLSQIMNFESPIQGYIEILEVSQSVVAYMDLRVSKDQ